MGATPFLFCEPPQKPQSRAFRLFQERKSGLHPAYTDQLAGLPSQGSCSDGQRSHPQACRPFRALSRPQATSGGLGPSALQTGLRFSSTADSPVTSIDTFGYITAGTPIGSTHCQPSCTASTMPNTVY